MYIYVYVANTLDLISWNDSITPRYTNFHRYNHTTLGEEVANKIILREFHPKRGQEEMGKNTSGKEVKLASQNYLKVYS